MYTRRCHRTVARVLRSVALVSPFWLTGLAVGAEEVRYYQQDGITYKETRQVVQRPITETRLQQSTQTVYRQELVTQCRDTVRTWWTPVTEYRWEARLVGRWNPFVEPYYEHRLTPYTRWEQRSETVKVPVTCSRLTPETRSVQVPVATQRMVSEEVVTRVAVGTAGTGLSAAPGALPQNAGGASPKAIGGIARLDGDPPRYGSDGAWRASTTR